MKEIKQEIIHEIDSRLGRLKEHQDDKRDGCCENQYEELNHSLSRVIGVSLENELESLRDFINRL